jgi:hypothetical protein
MEYLGADARIISKWILKKQGVCVCVCVCGLDSTGSGYSPVTGSCKRGNETSCSIKGD